MSASSATNDGLETGPVAVLGAGSWGTALAMQLARVGHRVRLWSRNAEHIEGDAARALQTRAIFRTPSSTLRSSRWPIWKPRCRARGASWSSTPSHAFGETLDAIADRVTAETGLAWATKGFEPGTGRFLSELARDRLGDSIPLAAVSGPSFAGEVARGLPTAVTVGASTPEFGRDWASCCTVRASAPTTRRT